MIVKQSVLSKMAEASAAQRDAALADIDEQVQQMVAGDWLFTARAEQMPPPGDWRIWLIMAGRGFGKTRAGAEWVRAIAEANPRARIALVGANLHEARAVMVEGESGLLAIAPASTRPHFEPSLRRLQWRSGAQAWLYSAAEPDSLRGAAHSHAWCDEIGKWDTAADRATAAWDNLLLGLRYGDRPQLVATTTPRAVPLVRDLATLEGVAVTRGSSADNVDNLPDAFIPDMRARYGASPLGRQELDGELLTEVEGALWSRELLDACRVDSDRRPRAGGGPGQLEAPACAGATGSFTRIVIGVDPPVSTHGDACGIIVAALGADGHCYILADHSVERPSPEAWARVVAVAAEMWNADRVVAEANQGGAMVRSVLHAADINLPVKLVHAAQGKVARAEPVLTLYQAGRVYHAAQFPHLEDELCGLMAGGEYHGPGRSPDRADALVWAVTELLLVRRNVPRVRW